MASEAMADILAAAEAALEQAAVAIWHRCRARSPIKPMAAMRRSIMYDLTCPSPFLHSPEDNRVATLKER